MSILQSEIYLQAEGRGTSETGPDGIDVYKRQILCNVAESYFRDNRDKFHFNYEIIDWEEVT